MLITTDEIASIEIHHKEFLASNFEEQIINLLKKQRELKEEHWKLYSALHENELDTERVNKTLEMYKDFFTIKYKVKEIEAVGQEFDPNLHNAVMQVESEEYESGVVAQELQKGYTYRDQVVRHSMVAVVS